MKRFIRIVIFFLVIIPLASSAGVGVKAFSWQNGPDNLLVMGWYPSTETGYPFFDYYGLVDDGQAVWDAIPDLTNGPYPLLVFSHGLGTCAYQSVFLAEHLASQGYVVIAPDHQDAAICHINGGSDLTNKEMVKAMIRGFGNFDKTVSDLFPDHQDYLSQPDYRPEEVSFVLSQVTAEPFFFFLIDYTKIGAFGHSFGGWTTMAVAGAEIDCTDPASYAPAICSVPDQPLSTKKLQQKLCCQPQYQGQRTSFYDPRVKAALILAPGAFIFPNYDTLDIDIPVMMIGGDHFEVDWQTNLVEPYQRMQSPKYLLRICGVDHLTVSDRFASVPGAKLLRGFWFYSWKKQAYNNYSTAFFQAYLQGDHSPLNQLVSQCCLFRKIWYEN